MPNNSAVGHTTQSPVLEVLFFMSPSCGPCPTMESLLLETIKKRNLPIKVTKIDVTKAPEVAEKYDVIACPTLIFRGFMKLCGSYERAELEELVSNYFASAFEFQATNSVH